VWSGNIYRREGILVERNTAVDVKVSFCLEWWTERESDQTYPGTGMAFVVVMLSICWYV
jgi:hypothetical protein